MFDPEKFLEFIKDRRTIRRFEDKEIPPRSIEMILEAGRWTPSASNRQPWEFIVIKNKEMLKRLWDTKAVFSAPFRRAPLAIAIVGKTNESPNWYETDTALASMNIMLMAWALNLGTCWIGSMDRKKSKEVLGLREDDFILTIIPIGYVKGKIPKPPLRKELDQISREIV